MYKVLLLDNDKIQRTIFKKRKKKFIMRTRSSGFAHSTQAICIYPATSPVEWAAFRRSPMAFFNDGMK